MKTLCFKLCILVCLWATWPTWADSEVTLPYEILDSGTLNGAPQNKPMLQVLRDQKALDTFSPHSTQSIDFSKKTVIAIVDSDQPNSGYRLILDRIEQHNGELWVYVIREQPDPSCLNLGKVAQPFVMITVNQFKGPAKLVFNTRMVAC
jgi:hypothetical protein